MFLLLGEKEINGAEKTFRQTRMVFCQQVENK
jgi:hypothetical protein